MEGFVEFMASSWGIAIFTVVAVAIVVFFFAVNYRFFAKAVLDFVFALLALIVLSPCIGVCAAILKKKCGTVFERVWAVGKGGRPVQLHLFCGYQTEEGGQCYIRRSAIMYFPLLADVLSGKLSIVGPTALALRDGAVIPEQFDRRFSVRPGIFSPAVTAYPSKPSFEEMFAFDCNYAAGRSLLTDVRTVFTYALRAVRGEGYSLVTLGRAGLAEHMLENGELTPEQFAETENIASEEVASAARAKMRVG